MTKGYQLVVVVVVVVAVVQGVFIGVLQLVSSKKWATAMPYVLIPTA